MTGPPDMAGRRDLGAREEDLLTQLRAERSAQRQTMMQDRPPPALTLGQRLADAVVATMGSWPFIIGQTVILAAWVVLNVVAFTHKWDPYPFILLNLALSFQAAYAAPIIMMSQIRQQQLDRQEVEQDFRINIKAELEIELLHQKIDALREKEILVLTSAVEKLAQRLAEKDEARSARSASEVGREQQTDTESGADGPSGSG